MITVNNDKLEEYKLEEYKKLVPELIRKKYTINDEYNLTNKGIEDKTDADYVAYREYVSECKAEAKKEIYGDATA